MRKYTFKTFDAQFPNDDACLEWLKQNRWPNGITCEACQRVTKHYRVTRRPAYACEFCGKMISPMAGTIMEKSSTPLRSWFHAMFLMASTRCGISAKQLERELGVTYKTAWRMFRQIRSMLGENVILEGSSVEVDETYVGGKSMNRHKAFRDGKRGRGAAGKTPVFGMVERKGSIVAKVVPDATASSVLPEIQARVSLKSVVYSDELHSYDRLGRMGYDHRRIHHVSKVYVVGDIHTNTIEGFWSLVKRGINGVYHSVSPEYLQSYVNEYAFRYNRRGQEEPMFQAFLAQVARQAV
ncbi:MAG: transposase [Dehalococcoidia bacterium]|nr:transposase [Dehalococcoidia bacterium]